MPPWLDVFLPKLRSRSKTVLQEPKTPPFSPATAPATAPKMLLPAKAVFARLRSFVVGEKGEVNGGYLFILVGGLEHESYFFHSVEHHNSK